MSSTTWWIRCKSTPQWWRFRHLWRDVCRTDIASTVQRHCKVNYWWNSRISSHQMWRISIKPMYNKIKKPDGPNPPNRKPSWLNLKFNGSSTRSELKVDLLISTSLNYRADLPRLRSARENRSSKSIKRFKSKMKLTRNKISSIGSSINEIIRSS